MFSLAHAQEVATNAANPAAPGGFVQFLPFILVIAVFWFLIARPNMKRAKEHRLMTEGLQKGDEVITQGGLAGRVVRLGEGYLAVEVANGVEVTVQRSAIQMVLPKGTLKSAL